MSISLRSIREKMRETLPGQKISEDAVRMLRIHVEREIVKLTHHANAVHDGENEMRKQIGERSKVILSARHMKMAIQGRLPKLEEGEVASSED